MLREGSSPVCPGCPGIVRAVEDGGGVVFGRRAGEEGAVFVEAGFVVFVGVGEVEVPVVVTVVEFDSDGVVGVLIDGPDETDQVDAEVFAVAAPGGAPRLE